MDADAVLVKRAVRSDLVRRSELYQAAQQSCGIVAWKSKRTDWSSFIR